MPRGGARGGSRRSAPTAPAFAGCPTDEHATQLPAVRSAHPLPDPGRIHPGRPAIPQLTFWTARRQATSGLERFDRYRLAVQFAALAASLVPRGHAALRDQLERASTSVVLNTAEGYGRWQAREKAHF